MANVSVKGANLGNIATSGGRNISVTAEGGIYVEGNLTISQVPIPRQWLRPAETDPLRRWEQAIGRLDELDTLRSRLSPAGAVDHPAAIWGMPGVGKSTLAALMAHKYGGDYAGGCLWVELGRSFRKPEQCQPILDHWAGFAYGGDVQISAQPEHWQKLKFDYLAVNTLLAGHGPLLVVLDDMWDLEATEPLRQALPADARLLVTTRDRRIADELGAFQLDILTRAEAIDLLRARLPDLPAATLESLAEGLGRHAHALSIAAGDIRRRSNLQRREKAVAEILERLETGQGFGELPQLDQRNRQSAVEVAMRASYDDIGDVMGSDYQRRFRFLGTFGPPEASFSTAAVAALWVDEPGAAAEFLDVLRDRALIRQVADDRWAQHLLVHAYNVALLRRENEHDAARQRYLEFVVKFTDQAFDLPPKAWGALSPDLPHVRFVGEWLCQHATSLLGELEPLAQPAAVEVNPPLAEHDELVLQMAYVFATNVLVYVVERAEEGIIGRGWLWMGLATARWFNAAGPEATFLFALGLWHQQRGWLKAAYQYYDASLKAGRQLEMFPHEPVVLINFGQVSLTLGETEQAVDCATRALDISRQRQDTLNEALALNLLGMASLALGKPDEGLQALQSALPLVQGAHNPGQEAVILQNVAYAYLEAGQLQKALQLFEQGLPMLPGDSGTVDRAVLLQNTGMTYYALRQPQQALKLLEQALAMAREAGDRNLEATILSNLGVIHEALGQSEQALSLLETALPMLRETGNRNMEALALLNLGFKHFGAGQLDQALTNTEQALAIFEDIASPGNIGLTRFLMSNILERRGQAEQGAAALQPIVEQPTLLRATADKLTLVALGLADPRARLQMILFAAGLYRNADLPARAIELLEQALLVLDELDDTTQFVSVYWLLTNLYTAAGLSAKAAQLNRHIFSNTRHSEALLNQLQTDLQKVDDPAALSAARALLGSLKLIANQPREAAQLLELALAGQPANDRSSAGALLNYLGMAYQGLGQPKRALEYFEQAIPLARAAGGGTMEALVLNNMGLAHRSQARFDLALEDFRRAMDIARQNGDRLNEGVILGNVGFTLSNLHRLPEALDTLQQALAITREVDNREQEIKILTNLQQTYVLSDQPDAARKHGELAVSLARESGNKPLEATVLSNYGIFLAEQPGEKPDAVSHIEQAIDVLETYHLPQDAAGQTAEQLRFILTSLKAGTDDDLSAGAGINKLLALLNAPTWADARKIVETEAATLLSLSTDQALPMMIAAAENNGKREHAEVMRRYLELLQACRQLGTDAAFGLLEAKPPDGLWHWWWGTCLFESQATRAAADQFSRAVELEPNSPSFRFWRGRARMALGQLVEAVADYNRCLELLPDDGDSYYWRGCAYMQLSDVPAARADFERAVRVQPDDASNWRWLGRAQHRLGVYPAAVESLDRAVALSPEMAINHYWRARVRLEVGQNSGALEDLDQAGNLEKTSQERSASIALWRGVTELLLGQIEQGQRDWAKARALMPQDPTTPGDLGELALLEALRGELELARNHFFSALRPPLQVGQLDEQVGQLRQLVRLFPTRNQLSTLLAWLTDQLTSAGENSAPAQS